MTTAKQARDILRPLGISLSRTEYDEYRVNFYKGAESTAVYTDDLDDAVATGRHMAAHGSPRSRTGRYMSRTTHGNAERLKTRLDLLLDSVKPGEHAVTIDAAGYTSAQVDRIIAAARARGLHVSGTHRWLLIRDLRGMRRDHGNADLQPGRFYAYKGQKVWLDTVPGCYFAMVQGTALEARGKTAGEALKKLRDKLDSGAANYKRVAQRKARRR